MGIVACRWSKTKACRVHGVGVIIHICCNLNIRFATKCEILGPMRPMMCVNVKHIFKNGGECKGWNPMTPKCTPTLRVAFIWELRTFKVLVGKANKHQIEPPWHHIKVLKCRCLKYLHIVHLNLIHMNYDQKKRHESNYVTTLALGSWPK